MSSLSDTFPTYKPSKHAAGSGGDKIRRGLAEMLEKFEICIFTKGPLCLVHHTKSSISQINMGRELQKAKNRSSIAKIKQKPKSKKKILNNAIIAANW